MTDDVLHVQTSAPDGRDDELNRGYDAIQRVAGRETLPPTGPG